MGRTLRNLTVIAVVVATTVGAVAGALSTPLPTEFTSGGVRWGDLTGDFSGFYNEGSVCTAGNGFAMGDAFLLSSGQDDAFDNAGIVVVGGTPYVVPGGVNGPVDLTGQTLTTPLAATGPLTVAVQWQGAGPGTIREMVTLTNPGATDVTTNVVVETNVGSDSSTRLQASSTGDISGYPATARWFVTSEGDSEPTSDPVIVSVLVGPGSVASTATVTDCPLGSGGASVKEAEQADEAPDDDATPDGDVTASGTLLSTDEFLYTYNVTVPAGQTRYLMMFWALYETIAEGVAAGPAWNTNPADDSPALGSLPPATVAGLSASAAGDVSALAGLTATQLSQILNWNFGPVPVTLQPRFTG